MSDQTRGARAATRVVNGAVKVAPVLKKVPDTKTAEVLRNHIRQAQKDAARNEAQRKRKMHIHLIIAAIGFGVFMVVHLDIVSGVFGTFTLLPDTVPWATQFVTEIIDRILGT